MKKQEINGVTNKTIKPKVLLLIAIVIIQFILMTGIQIAATLILKDPDAVGNHLSPPLTILMKVLAHIIGGLVILFFAYLFTSKEGVSVSKLLGFTRPKTSKLNLVILAIASIAVVFLAGQIATAITQFLSLGESSQKMNESLFFEDLTTGWGILFIGVVGVFPSFFEEMTYRGFLQGRFMKRFNPYVAIGITSLIFGLVHIEPRGIILATVMGMWLGIIAWRIQSVWPAIICHAFVNSTSSFSIVGKYVWGFPETTSIVLKVIVGTFCIAALAYAVKILIQTKSHQDAVSIKQQNQNLKK